MTITPTDFIILLLVIAMIGRDLARKVESYKLDEVSFVKLIEKSPESAVVKIKGGLFSNKIRYMTCFHGINFHTISFNDLHFLESDKFS